MVKFLAFDKTSLLIDKFFTFPQNLFIFWLNIYLLARLFYFLTNLYLLVKPLSFIANYIFWQNFYVFMATLIALDKTLIFHG